MVILMSRSYTPIFIIPYETPNPSHQVTRPKKFDKWMIMTWILSIGCIFTGGSQFFTSPAAGSLMVFAGTILLPPFAQALNKKYHILLPGWVKIVSFMFILGLSSSFHPFPSNQELTNQTVPLNTMNVGANTLPDTPTAIPPTIPFSPTPTPTLLPLPTLTPTLIPTQRPTVIYLAPTAAPLNTPTPTLMPLTQTSTSTTQQSNICAGTTALCKDGTCSKAVHHQGACSGHGGVAEWYP
jgi:hypothetical protein